MTDQEFLVNYWRNYILLEKEYFGTEQYVALDTDNYSTFSANFGKLLLQIGSEVDIEAKMLCNLLQGKTPSCIVDYKAIITQSFPEFTNINVTVLNRTLSFQPWIEWKTDNSPTWWKSYNGYKHNRLQIENGRPNYKNANLKNIIFSLGGLYQLEIYTYYELTSRNNQANLPMPGSRLFRLNGDKWDQMNFPQDISLSVDNGTLSILTSVFQY